MLLFSLNISLWFSVLDVFTSMVSVDVLYSLVQIVREVSLERS